MEFTFGIITNGHQEDSVARIIESIRALKIPVFEILIVGPSCGNLPLGADTRFVEFDESVKPNWITRKKNMLCEMARYENIVLLHDYVVFQPDWYTGFLRFGNSFDVCVTRILNLDGRRFRDHTLFPLYMRAIDARFATQCLLPYTFKLTPITARLSYLSGAYYVVKKHIALQYPLDESKSWGEGEDVEFSYRIACDGILSQVNPYSTVSLLKQKDNLPWQVEITNPDLLNRLKTLTLEDAMAWKRDPECFHLFPILHI